MNNAIVICYVGRAIKPEIAGAIQHIITDHCNAMPELITIKAFDEDSIAKALLERATVDLKDIPEVLQKNNENIIVEGRKKAIAFIKERYSGTNGPIMLMRDVILAKHSQSIGAATTDQEVLIGAINLIADAPQVLSVQLSKQLREAIFAVKDA